MGIITLTTFLAIFTFTLGEVMPQSEGWGSAQPATAGLVSNQHVLFLANVSSKLDCGRLCVKHDCCAAFTTSPNPSSSSSTPRKSMTCQGHESRSIMADNAAVDMAGSKTYLVKRSASESSWMHGACFVANGCPVTNSDCFSPAGHCLCEPGYFYSHCRDACIPDCPTQDLQPTFVKYPTYSLTGANGIIDTVSSADECQKTCTQNAECISVNFNTVSNRCIQKNIRVLDSPADFKVSNNYDHYQRTCL